MNTGGSTAAQWAMRLGTVLAGLAGGVVVAFAVFVVVTGPLPPPYGSCFHDKVHDLPPAVGPGAPKSQLVRIAVARVRAWDEQRPVRLENTRVEVQDWGDHWKVNFRVPTDKDFWGCEIMRQDGDGPTVEIRKHDMQPYRIYRHG